MATKIDVEGVMVSEISKTDKDKYHILSLIYGIKRKNTTNSKIKDTDSQIKRTN